MRFALILTGIAAGFVVCWSSGFIGTRLATGVTDEPLAFFAWRFGMAALLAGGLWCWTGGRLTPAVVLGETLTGLLTVGAYLLGMLLAIRYGVSAGVASLIGALQPLFAIVLTDRLVRRRTPPRHWLGMTVATAGVAVCVLDDVGGAGTAPWWSYTLPFAAVVSVSVGSVIAGRLPQTTRLAATLTVQLAAAAAVFLVAALLAGEQPLTGPPRTLGAAIGLAWLIGLSTFGGYGFFVTSLRRLGIARTSMLVYLTPPVTMLWEWSLFGDQPGAIGLAGMAIAGGGVWLALRKNTDPHPDAVPAATKSLSERSPAGRAFP